MSQLGTRPNPVRTASLALEQLEEWYGYCRLLRHLHQTGQARTARPETAAQHRYHRMLVDRDGLDNLLVDLFLESQAEAPEEIWLDRDATDDPTHGQQEGRFYHGYYREHCYLPLYIFCEHHALCARLRTADRDASDGSVEELERIVGRIRERWPATRIRIRADAGFCRDGILSWCEANAVGYVLGLARNPVLTRRFRHAMRRFRQFRYRTHSSWSRKRRVPVCNVMTRNAVIQVRIDPATRDRRRRLRLERHVNVSAWIRQLVQDALDRELGK